MAVFRTTPAKHAYDLRRQPPIERRLPPHVDDAVRWAAFCASIEDRILAVRAASAAPICEACGSTTTTPTGEATSGTSADSPHSGEAKNLVLSSEVVDPDHRRDRNPERYWRMASTRIGVPCDVYRTEYLAGNRWCTRCRAFQPASEFVTRQDRIDGIAGHCLESNRTAARESARRRYVPVAQRRST